MLFFPAGGLTVLYQILSLKFEDHIGAGKERGREEMEGKGKEGDGI